jgi:hypothetical protein
MPVTVAPVADRPGYFAATTARGWPADAVLIMRHAGSDHDAIRGRLGALAKLPVEDGQDGVPRLRRGRPSQYVGVSPPVRFRAQPVLEPAPTAFERVLARGRP